MIRATAAALILSLAGTAQGPPTAVERPDAGAPGPANRPGETAESLTAWEWFHEIAVPASPAKPSPWIDLILTPQVFDRARADLADLRIYDGREREVQYALRVRRTQNEEQPLPAREFNRQEHPDGSVEISLDLGEKPVEHQVIEVVTAGSNFRRLMRVEGSDNRRDWGVLAEEYLVHFRVGSEVVSVRQLRYPASRFRYLRARVFRDSGVVQDRPAIQSVAVYHSVQVPGEYVTRRAALSAREPVPAAGAPGSAWTIDLGANWVPVERLAFRVDDEEYARPYSLEAIGLDGSRRFLAHGEWRRRAGEERTPMQIRFNEITAGKLRLVVTDHRNPPLSIQGVEYTAAARQVVFAKPQDASALRLYVGNPKAVAPNYDFAANLPAVLKPAPIRADLGPQIANPVYEPEPKPWTERWPWLVYVVLAGASLILLVMLGLLARATIAQHDAAHTPAESAVEEKARVSVDQPV